MSYCGFFLSVCVVVFCSQLCECSVYYCYLLPLCSWLEYLAPVFTPVFIVCLFCLSLSLSLCLSLFLYLSICLSVCLSVCLSIYLSICRSPPDFIVTRDATPVLGQSPAPANASATSRKAIAQPSQWPGLRGWPRTLASTDWCITRCSDKASLSLLLGEACVAVYVGMVAVSLAKLSARRLLCLLKNMPGEKV